MQWVATWAEVALDQYLALGSGQQTLIDSRLEELVGAPDGEGCRYDQGSDTWTTTDAQAGGFNRLHVQAGEPSAGGSAAGLSMN